MDEYNTLRLINNQPPKNAVGGNVTFKNQAVVPETASVSETSQNLVEEFGSTRTADVKPTSKTLNISAVQKLSAAASSVTVTASAATVVAAVVVVAVATSTGITAPDAFVMGADVSYYNGESIRVEFALEDEDGELESFYAWIEDEDGTEITCEITAGDGAYYAEAAITEETSGGLYFVVYAASNGGWEGELYRGLLTLPTAPDITVEYNAEYTAESGELTITYQIDDTSLLTSCTARIFDNSGEVESSADYAANTITAVVTDTQNLYFVIDCEAVNGWAGEIYRDKITIPDEEEQTEPTEPTAPDEDEQTEPTAPDVTVSYSVTYKADSAELVITFELSGESLLSDYAVQLTDGSSEIESTSDQNANTITATITDGTGVYLIISGETSDGWSGEIFSEAISIPTAPDTAVSYSAAYSAESRELTINFEISDTSALTSYAAKLYDSSGNSVECTVDYDMNTITAAMGDSSDVLNLVIETVSADGWTGTLYSAEIDLSSLAPTVEVTGAAVTLYSDETNLTVQFTIDDPDGELAYHKVIIADAGGGEVSCSPSINGSVYTATADISSLDASGGLTLIVYVISNTGWDGNLYSGAITLPTAPDVSLEIGSESSYESGLGGSVDFYPSYYSDTSDIVEFRYWIEDMNGQTYECTEDEYGIARITFTAEDTIATDDSGCAYFVIYVTTSDGWQGTIYRELEYIDYSVG